MKKGKERAHRPVPSDAPVEDSESGGLPPLIPLRDFVANHPPEDPPLVDGLFRVGEKVFWGGSSKSFKTWAMMDMAASIGAGVPFLGRQTRKGRVIYANLELRPGTFAKRWEALLRSRNLAAEDCDVDVWNLRGTRAGIEVIAGRLQEEAEGNPFVCVVIDPAYKLLKGRDENMLSAAAELGDWYEAISEKTGASVVCPQHFPKGDVSMRSHMDRISGTGGFARDGDAIITMTSHESEGAFVVEATLRSLPPVGPFVVRWEYPVFVVDEDLNPADIRRPGPKCKYDIEAILSVLKQGPLSEAEWLAKAKAATGQEPPRSSFADIIRRQIGKGRVRKSPTSGNYYLPGRDAP